MGGALSLASLRWFLCPPLIRNNHFSLSLTPSLPCLLYGYTGLPGWNGTEQEETGLTQAAETTGSTRAATATRKGPVRMLLFFVIVSLLSSFLHFTLLLFRLFLFRQVKQQAGHERKAPDGRNAADGANGYAFFYVFALSTY